MLRVRSPTVRLRGDLQGVVDGVGAFWSFVILLKPGKAVRSGSALLPHATHRLWQRCGWHRECRYRASAEVGSPLALVVKFAQSVPTGINRRSRCKGVASRRDRKELVGVAKQGQMRALAAHVGYRDNDVRRAVLSARSGSTAARRARWPCWEWN